MSEFTVTQEVVEQIDAGLAYGLSGGLGERGPGTMCGEALVCAVLGEPHGDEPSCVDPTVRAFYVNLNDTQWSSNAARAAGMRDLTIAQLGSRDAIDERVFTETLVRETIKRIVPMALRAAAKVHPDVEHRAALENAAQWCEIDADSAAAAAYASAAAAAAYAADDAYYARASERAWQLDLLRSMIGGDA